MNAPVDPLKEALDILQGLIQELDFDAAEGHPPSDTAKELLEKAKALIKRSHR